MQPAIDPAPHASALYHTDADDFGDVPLTMQTSRHP
jgi:hypothetical protein